MPNATNVTLGKPKVAGHIYRAPLGTTLPTDAVSALNQAFVDMGYISDSGVVNSNSPDTDVIRAWGGDIVITTNNGRDDNFQFTMLEYENLNVLKAIYGDSNVSGTLAAGVSINATNADLGDYSWVIEMVLRGNVAHRIVIPDAQIAEIGDINYVDNDAASFPVTLNAISDSNGVTHKAYMKSASTGTTGTT